MLRLCPSFALVALVAACQGKAPVASDTNAGARDARPEEQQAPPVMPDQNDGGPKIELGELVLEGPRDGAPIIEAAISGIPALRKCYADRLEKDPNLGGGEVALRLLVTPSGRIEDALLHNNKLPDHRVGTCMLGVAKTWTLPPVDHTEPTRVILPLHLDPPPGS
jgi:hypothetical protein